MESDRRRHRKSIRLSGRSYTDPGVYFITIRTSSGLAPFGRLDDGPVELNALGVYANRLWQTIPARYETMRLDRFVIMPDHLHGLLIITGEIAREASREEPTLPPESARPTRVRPGSIGAVVEGLKGAVTSRQRRAMRDTQVEVWQRGFYERVVRDAAELARIRWYIAENPARAWKQRIENCPVYR